MTIDDRLETRTTVANSDDPTIGRLVRDVTDQISALVKMEIALVKSEVKVSVKFGVVGIVLFAVAAFVGVLAIIMLSIAIAYLINWNGDGLALHWAYLIVFGLYTVLAALLALLGLKKVKQVGPPEKAIEQGKEIPAALKGRSS